LQMPTYERLLSAVLVRHVMRRWLRGETMWISAYLTATFCGFLS
jgi:hypothetical protein